MKPSSPCPTVSGKRDLSFWERANGLWQQANIRGLQVALGTVLSLALLWLAFRDVPLSQVVATFSRADYRFVALALALVLVSPLARAARWRLLYHPDQKGLSYFRLAEVLLISQMLNIVVPARLGEVARIYFMGKIESQSRARTLGTIAVEKWLDILVLLLLVLLVPVFVSLPPWFRDSRLSLAVFATAFLGVTLTLSYGKDQMLTLVEWGSRFLPQSWRARIHRATGLALGSLDVLRSPWVELKLQGSDAHPGGMGLSFPARRLAPIKNEDSSGNRTGPGKPGCAALSLGGA